MIFFHESVNYAIFTSFISETLERNSRNLSLYNPKRYSKSSKFKGCYWSFETHPLKKPRIQHYFVCLDCMLSIIRGRKRMMKNGPPFLHFNANPFSCVLELLLNRDEIEIATLVA